MESKPRLFLHKFKELTELADSMSEEEIRILMCSLEYLQLNEKYPEYIKL